MQERATSLDWVESPEPKTQTRLVLGQAVSDLQRQEVFRLRYQVYIEEMNRGCHADHDKKMIYDHLDATSYIATAHYDGQLIGTCRANFSASSDFEHREIYGFDAFEAKYPRAVMFVTKLMVAPQHRKSSAFLRICRQIYETGLKRGAFVMVIDCNDHLVKSFASLGFKMYKGQANHPEFGTVNPMVLYMHDAEYLRAIGSAFYPVLKRHISTTNELLNEESA